MNLNAVLHHIPPLDMEYLSQPAPAVEEYLRFYKLDFGATLTDVRQHIGSFESGSFDLVCQLFLRSEARGTVFVVHGFYDHVGLYAPLIGHLLSKNYSVVAFDLPGHGLSTGEAASISSFSHYDKALDDCVRHCQEYIPGPFYVVGQSTGGAAVMSFLLRQRHRVFEKTVLLAPLVRPRGWRLGRLAHLALAPFKEQLPRKFRTNSHDLDFVEFVQNKDPLQNRHLKFAWVSALKQWLKWFLRLPSTDVPILVIQGKSDLTVDWQYNMKVIKEKFPSARFIYIGQADHHLVGESTEIRCRVFQSMDLYFDGLSLPDDIAEGGDVAASGQGAT